MQPSVSEICFVGVYGHEQNDFLRAGLEEQGVTVTDAGLSTRRYELRVFGRPVPLYPMKPTLNWFGSYPSTLVPLFFLLTFLVHGAITWSGVLANISAVRRADTLVVPHLGDTSVIAIKPVATVLGTPLVYLSHNGLYFTLVENREAYDDPHSIEFLRTLDHLTQRWSDRVVVFSHHSKTVLSDTFELPERKYDVVYLSVGDSRFSGSDEVTVDRTVDVLYWGNFIPHHAVGTMVNAAAALPNCQFVFVGRSDAREAIQGRADRLELDNVAFPGFVSSAVLGAYIREADIVLGPLGDYTQTRMNIGTKVAEACAMRKAVILADHPAPNEVFDHKHSALLIPAEDDEELSAAIRSIRSDDTLKHRLETKSYEVYEDHFAPQSTAEQFVKLLRRATVKAA